MIKHVSLLAALLLAAGCAQESSHQVATTKGAGKALAFSLAGAQHSAPISLASAAARHGGQVFANAPDRGELLAYPAQRVVRHDGAYTWHRADLSEVHALRALASGVLRLTTPAGEALSFKYERSVEHPSGDWTWIGRLIGGNKSDEVILTFGAKAAFGSIAQRGGKLPLKLTIQNGVSWLVESDPSKIAQINNEATHPTGEDYLVVPRLEALRRSTAAAPSTGMTVAPPMAGAVATLAGPTVDLVLGYTTGFAAGLGGASQANTRLAYMVDTTNQAYVNSQVPGSVRLVKTLEVSYPDNTSNSDTLEKLTGYRSGSGQITPDAAFSALRAARDTYGADLVSLVRKFSTPENDGCGIAWLIGGSSDGTGNISQSDAYFGYSVVSDGRDAGTDGKNYFCREETLAHELGHNMGSQHDRATATDNGTVSYGVYPYSFGYKTASSAGNFYDIMAYGDAGQTPYRVFSNPRVTYCGGLPCGIENQADVARSLTNTMPTVATFRATVVASTSFAVKNDINGDGRSDILWRNFGSELFLHWDMNAATFISSGASTMVNTYNVATTGDFNGDGRADLLWKNDSARVLYMWFSGPNGFTQQFVRSFPADWNLVGAGDINGDGKSDLLWRNEKIEQFSYWIMDGAQVVRSAAYTFVNTYSVGSAGDFDGDGKLDILWVRPGYNMYMWMGDGNGFTLRYVAPHVAGWEVVGAADVNGDRKSDILMRNFATEQFKYMVMDGPQTVREAQQYMVNTYQVASAGDFNGDGLADILWIRPGYNLYMWQGNGTGFAMQYVGTHSSGWSVVPSPNL